MRRAVLIVGLGIGGAVALGLATLVLLVVTGTLKAYAIPSSAMEPTLHCARPAPGCDSGWKDRVLALTRLVSYGRGDLIVFRTSRREEAECGVAGTYVKRVIGLPGETVEIRLLDGAAHVYVDGSKLEERYIENERRDVGPEERFQVPNDHFFVLGDNRAQSCDSRIFGPVSEDEVVGKLVATYWPPNRISFR